MTTLNDHLALPKPPERLMRLTFLSCDIISLTYIKFLFKVIDLVDEKKEAVVLVDFVYEPNNQLGKTLTAMGFKPLQLDGVEEETLSDPLIDQFIQDHKGREYVANLYWGTEGMSKQEWLVNIETIKEFNPEVNQ
ncbi:hypothetical protein VB620_04960 [Nodularia harveyana UHCC-0300]|uniref:Uncharacterized protein n=1 Tax=Nodularia harveyana UHCC-0300 TaxID=2974287 RepID=A0ABU5UAZ1_9CYAN|nr:hypothetical protein [Nodularia harveyana]MEA5580690.1 hypothetical protein [Nodularia harveyana UHCC-0300]